MNADLRIGGRLLRYLVAVAACLCGPLRATALAHNGVPGGATVFFSDGEVTGGVTELGVLIRRGTKWDWTCEESIDEVPNAFVVLSNGTILTATRQGVLESSDGCGWSRVSGLLATAVVTGLSVRADEVVAVTATPGSSNGVFRKLPNSLTFEPLLTPRQGVEYIDVWWPAGRATGLTFARGDDQRLELFEFAEGVETLVSDDFGAARFGYIVGETSDLEVLVVLTDGLSGVLGAVTKDAGAFREIVRLENEIADAALAAAGTFLVSDGRLFLYDGTLTDLGVSAGCVESVGPSDVWICAHPQSGAAFQRISANLAVAQDSTISSADFAPAACVNLRDSDGVCTAVWQELADANLVSRPALRPEEATHNAGCVYARRPPSPCDIWAISLAALAHVVAKKREERRVNNPHERASP